MLRHRLPLVSIAMPVRNCEKTLAAAIRSIQWQTFTDWELLLVDDGSTDATLSVANQFKDPRIRLFSDGRPQGLAPRLNQAIAESQGIYLARMDGDDIAYPRRIERQAGFLCDHPDVDLAGTSMLVFGVNGIALGKRAGGTTHNQICARPTSGFPLSHPTFVGRLAWFKHWQFDPLAESVCDQDLLLRSFSSSRFANLPDILHGYREEKIQLTKMFKYRCLFAGSLMRYFAGKYSPATARAILEQAVKACIDCIAVGTGMNHRLLHHRAESITPSEQTEWEGIWRAIYLAQLAP